MSIPAGYYDDGSGRQRWWDGVQWTDSYQAAVVAAPAYAATPVYVATPVYATAPGVPMESNKRLWITGLCLWVGGAILSMIGGIVIGASATNLYGYVNGGAVGGVGTGIALATIGGIAALVGFILFIVGLVQRRPVRSATTSASATGYPPYGS